MGETLLQFKDASAPHAGAPQPTAQSCPVCHQNFSSDARFCPFDGEPLIAAQNYDPSSDPLLGTVVDQRYEVEHVLGEGGMGTVYRVRHVALGKAFALKALRADLAADSEIAERFIGEARTAAAISHPGLVEITDFGRLPDGRPYFVMELLDGEPLSWFIRKVGALPAARALGVVRQVADAVAAAHRAGIVHRDLKPDNVHITPGKDGTDRVKVLDFGLAKVMGRGRRTRDGIVFGTPHYMSPEQAAGENVDHRADIYSLGIVTYEMLTGRVPFEADTFMGVLSKHIYMQPLPPSQLPGVQELGALESIVLRCLEKKPARRYQSFDELLVDAERAAIGFEQVSSPRGQAPSLPGVPSSSVPSTFESGSLVLPVKSLRPVVFAVAVVLFMVAGFFVVRALRTPGSPGQPAAAALPHGSPATALGVVAPAIQSVPAPGPAAAPASSPAPASSVAKAHEKPRSSGAAQAAPSGKTEEGAVRRRKPAGIRGEIIDPWGQ